MDALDSIEQFKHKDNFLNFENLEVSDIYTYFKEMLFNESDSGI